MSIKPEFVSGILSGRKRYEYRRSIFRRPVDVAVIYATSPIQRVVGEFDIEGIIRLPVNELWDQTHEFAGIDARRFFGYFGGVEEGFAIEIGGVRLYEEPLGLPHHFGIAPPQSFVYLDFPWPLC